ncbi:Fc.00g018020.m01.CDS01 [Cosmosporella sp. VM-42]
MTTPSADIMSSPDPLNESNVVMPSSINTRRVTRSQLSDRFASVGPSPRKQMFELEVGDNKSPRKLLVTVESEDAHASTRQGDARRRLFQSSSPLLPAIRRRERATTTTVPLRDTIEEEPATPRRRGRPRKSNGTPLPSAGMKRRAGTPLKKSPRKARMSTTTEMNDESREPSVQPTPQSAKRGRGRPPKNRTTEPSSELGTEPTPKATSKKRGRPRRLALNPDELLEMADEAAETSVIVEEEPEPISDVITVLTSPEQPQIDEPHEDIASQSIADAESDIWMATLDDEPTPRAANPSAQSARIPSPQAEPSRSPEPEPEVDPSEVDDYGYLPPAASDVSSTDEPPTAARARNNDTIAQGEEFSMIFMDSIPSLQETLRSSMHEPSHNDFGEETSLIINNTLESLRRSQQGTQDMEVERAETAETSNPVLPPPTSAEPHASATRPPISLSPNRNRLQNLSPSWTQSPRRGGFSPLRHQVLKFKARQSAEDETPRDTSIVHGGQSSAISQRMRISARRNDEESNFYEDSFSEIPQGVLEAATPRRPAAPRREDEEADQPIEEMADEMADEQMEEVSQEQNELPTASNTSVVSRSDAGRLPTPDDTPPHADVQEAQNQGKSTQESQSSQMIASPSQPQNLPQIVEDIIEEADEEQIEEILPEVSQPRSATHLLDDRLPQIEVTPINQMTSPLQEPVSVNPEATLDRSRRPTLSPIVRAGRALQSVTSDPPSPEPRENQLRSPFRSSASKEQSLGGRGMSISPRRPLAFPEVTQIPPPNQAYEDPFGSDTRHTGQISFMQALGRSSTAAPQKSHLSSRESNGSSMRITPPSEDEMSWVANEGPISANLRGDVSLRVAAQSSTVGAVSGTIPHGQLDGATADMDETPEERDDEMDIWEFEAQRATPRTTRQQPFGKKVAAPVHRRGTLPSPWTKQGPQKRPQSAETVPRRMQEPEFDVDRTEEAAAEAVDMQEYSLLAQREKAQQPNKAPESVVKASRFDLSSFFSSPAAIPGKIAEKLLPGRLSGFGAKTNEPRPAQEAAVLPTSSMFPQVPQKEFRPSSASRTNLFSSTRTNEQATPQDEDMTPDTPERIEMPSVAQKKNFTPRPRQPSQSLFQPPARSGAPTPPRMQLSHADIQRWQQQTSEASEDSPELSQPPLLRPLPPRNASPNKSSLRSPLKPHTPGRVVEFTSSVLSPVEQAKVRHQRRLSNSSVSQPGMAPQILPQQTDDKENHEASDVSMSDASPLVKNPHPELLSQTLWTRQHWLLLDELLQLRRLGSFELNYERRAEKYLGKMVKSQGEAMRLERWHLDCVDAFKAEIGGWDEAVLVKRLFALILGEERRNRGVVERPARVMFH